MTQLSSNLKLSGSLKKNLATVEKVPFIGSYFRVGVRVGVKVKVWVS